MAVACYLHAARPGDAAAHAVAAHQVLDPAPTGTSIAGFWAAALNRPIQYGGDDTAAFEQRMRAFAPGWMAYDMRLMMGRIRKDGMLPNPGDTECLTELLGRPLRSYRDFAAEAARQRQT